MILQSVPNSLEMISSLVNDKVTVGLVLDKFGETLTEEEKLFLEEETKLAKQELAHLRCGYFSNGPREI